MRRLADKLFVAFAWTAGIGVPLVALVLVGFLMKRGVGTLGPGLIFGDAVWWRAIIGGQAVFDGIWPAIVGTLLLVLGSSLMAVPLGVAAGVYLAEFATSGRRRFFGFFVDVLSGVPSIIMGLFGFGLILVLRRTLLPAANTCLLLSMMCIALLVLPYLARTTQAALAGLPAELRLIGPALGLSRWQSIRHVHLPAAGRGILSGVILAVGRAAEDTAVILLTGVVANAGLPGGIAEKFEALPFSIFYLTANHRNVAELDRAFGSALVLLCLTATLFLCAAWMQRSLERRWRLR